MVRNLRCAVTIDSVLANSKTQNAFLFTVHAIFRHDYPLAEEPASTPRPLVQKKLWEILYLLICSFLPCLSWLLRSRVRKFRRDLWITLYYQECNELLIIFYTIDVTSHTLSLFGQTILDEVANRLSTYQRRRRNILHCVSQRVYKIIRRTTMFGCLLWFQVMSCWLYLEFLLVILETLVEYIF